MRLHDAHAEVVGRTADGPVVSDEMRPVQRQALDPVVVEMASHYWGVRSLHAEADLDWRVRDPRETLRDTIAWLREQVPGI